MVYHGKLWYIIVYYSMAQRFASWFRTTACCRPKWEFHLSPIKDVLNLVQVRILVGFYVSLGEGIRHRDPPQSLCDPHVSLEVLRATYSEKTQRIDHGGASDLKRMALLGITAMVIDSGCKP